MKSKASARRTRRTHDPASKARVNLAALWEDKALAELCEQFELHPNQIREWKMLLLERAAQVFDGGASPEQKWSRKSEQRAKWKLRAQCWTESGLATRSF